MYNISNVNDNYYNYNTTISKFCNQLNVGRNKFYAKLRELGILDEENMPTTEYQDYFVEYHSDYSEKAGRESFYITKSGQKFILSLLTPDDFDIMKRGKYASQRNRTNYKHYE